MVVELAAEGPVLPSIVRKSGMRFQDQARPVADGRNESDDEI